MSTPAQEGILSFGMQASRDVLPTVWYRHRADDVDLDIVQPMNTLPPEVGNDPVPTGTYKVGAFVGGGGTISPRMKKTFGYLPKGLMGDVATTADPPVTPTNWSHVFKFASGPTSLPWMGFRKLVPGSATLGLIGQGCKICWPLLMMNQWPRCKVYCIVMRLARLSIRRESSCLWP